MPIRPAQEGQPALSLYTALESGSPRPDAKRSLFHAETGERFQTKKMPITLFLQRIIGILTAIIFR